MTFLGDSLCRPFDMLPIESPTTYFFAGATYPEFGSHCPVIFSTHRTGPLIAENRMRSGSFGILSVGQVQTHGFPGKLPGALFLENLIQGTNLQFETTSISNIARLEKNSDAAIFWCLISTVTIFIVAMLNSMPVIG